MIGLLQAEGVTVFFSAHLLYEIEPICDQVAILHDGRIVRAAPVDELRQSVKRVLLEPREGAQLDQIPGLLDVQHHNSRWAITVEAIEPAREALTQLSRNGSTVVDLNLDEIFEAYVTGRQEVVHA